MNIYTNENTWSNIHDAAKQAGVIIDRSKSFTPTKTKNKGGWDYGFRVILSGDSARQQNGGPNKAATWDQWGVFLSVLFNVDPDMRCGSPSERYAQYKDCADFEWKTNRRFIAGIWPDDAHGDHTFRYGSCTKCSAVWIR